MKSIIAGILLPALLVGGPIFSQPKEPGPETPKAPLFGITFSGYVNSDLFFDSRQTVMAREGQWLFYPENLRRDRDGKDINARGTYNILSIQTRLSGNITGPEILGAKTSGLIEGEFYGSANASINTLRLRHAVIRLNWPRTELSLGQTWHPMFVPACAPEVVSLNTGAPFIVFSRNPQIRVTQRMGNFHLTVAAISQLDATSTGPDGPSPKYLRNSILPELAGQVRYGFTRGRTEFLAGAGVDFVMLTPRLNSEVVLKAAYDTVIGNTVIHHNAVTATYRATERSSALSYSVFAKVKFPAVTVKAGGFLVGNGYGFNMIGGYAVKSVTDSARGLVDYATVRTLSVWADIRTNGTKWSAGLYGGFSRNLGAGTGVTGPYYSRGSNIDYLYRVAPRMIFTVSKLKIATELDYTVAAYGTVTSNGLVNQSKEVGNLRVLVGVYYYF